MNECARADLVVYIRQTTKKCTRKKVAQLAQKHNVSTKVMQSEADDEYAFFEAEEIKRKRAQKLRQEYEEMQRVASMSMEGHSRLLDTMLILSLATFVGSNLGSLAQRTMLYHNNKDVNVKAYTKNEKNEQKYLRRRNLPTKCKQPAWGNSVSFTMQHKT